MDQRTATMTLPSKTRTKATTTTTDSELMDNHDNNGPSHAVGGAQIKLTKAAHLRPVSTHRNNQLSSLILFVCVIVLVNLCPFQEDFHTAQDHHGQVAIPQQHSMQSTGLNRHHNHLTKQQQDANPASVSSKTQQTSPTSAGHQYYLQHHLETCVEFVKLMFTNPIRLGKRRTRSTLAEARVLGKMAKVWYIKKKIKKLSKKLKKHTIAVPVFTAIPIYEHSYYPQPHVTHVSHHGAMHHAAASSYSPVMAQVPSAAATGATSAAAVAQGQQLATSASNTQQVAAYRLAPGSHHHHHPHAHAHHSPYYPTHAASAHQIINSYSPSPPLYVDEAGGLYGHYGNAYGRYDGGYQLW